MKNVELPVLVKFIDAKKDLSVQVHPDDEYAKVDEGDNGKTEMWYVIDVEEGSSLIYGFKHRVTEEILRKALETGTLDRHLQKVEVHKGDTYFVPAGTVHGIGEGILMAEIQESSNVTYRVVPFPVSWTVKMKKKQKETQDILSYHTQAAGCSDKARAKASGGRQPIEECGRTGL